MFKDFKVAEIMGHYVSLAISLFVVSAQFQQLL
jgi:hypothetical protein